MSPRKKDLQSLYLEPDRAELLDSLAATSRIPKAVLLREAVDDLLVKHKVLRAPRKPKSREAGGKVQTGIKLSFRAGA